MRAARAALAVAAASVGLGCDGASGAARPERIVLISMDTVRADRVDDSTAPSLGQIARQGVRFRNFYAASNYTLPSHASIFTGLDPEAHGLSREDALLAPPVATLAERLAAAGYRTQGEHEGGFVAARFGFDRGFEVYREHGRIEVVRGALPGILAWMRAAGDEPYFLFLHTYAAHFPYGGFARYRREHPERGLPSDEEIEQLRRRYPGPKLWSAKRAAKLPENTRTLCALVNQLAEQASEFAACGGYGLPEQLPGTPHFAEDRAAILRSYDARIGEIDAAIAAIRRTLEERGQWDDTLLVVTADHGEAFWEHGLARHDYIPFDEVLRVPLVISFPRRLGRAGRVVDDVAWHLDLAPTILALVGETPPVASGGVDLTPVLLGRGVLASGREVFPAVLRAAHMPPRPLRRAVRRGGWKFIEGHPLFGDGEGFVFDLDRDPEERRNLRREHPEVATALSARARDYSRSLERWPPVHQQTGQRLEPDADRAPVALPPQERQRLRDLGYVREDE